MDLSIAHLRALITHEPDDEAEAMIQQWPLRGGTGFFFTYFPLEIDMEHAIRISQTLAFIGTMTREPRVPSPLQVSRVLDVFCTGQYADLFWHRRTGRLVFDLACFKPHKFAFFLHLVPVPGCAAGECSD